MFLGWNFRISSTVVLASSLHRLPSRSCIAALKTMDSYELWHYRTQQWCETQHAALLLIQTHTVMLHYGWIGTTKSSWRMTKGQWLNLFTYWATSDSWCFYDKQQYWDWYQSRQRDFEIVTLERWVCWMLCKLYTKVLLGHIYFSTITCLALQKWGVSS